MATGIQAYSDLAKADDRFLCRILEQAFADSWRTPEDFLAHFEPKVLIDSLATDQDLRVQLLVATTQVHERIARKKSAASASEDLTLALEEATTTPAQVVELFGPVAQVRHLDRKELWQFLVEDEFWNAPRTEKSKLGEVAARITFILEVGLEENLLSLSDISDGIGFERVSSCLPPELLRKVLEHALRCGRDGLALNEERLLDIVELGDLMQFVPVAHTWQSVIVAKLAEPLGMVEPTKRTVRSQPPPASASARPPIPARPPAAKGKGKKAALPSAPAIEVDDWEPGRDELESIAGEAPDPKAARQALEQRLKQLDRLPPNPERLSLPVLASIESMYAELAELTEEEEKALAIREAFPNEGQFRSAMLALIELLDPTVDTTEPVIRDADADALIKIVLFEEKRRQDSSKRAVSNPPPLPSARATK